MTDRVRWTDDRLDDQFHAIRDARRESREDHEKMERQLADLQNLIISHRDATRGDLLRFALYITVALIGAAGTIVAAVL